MLDFTGSRFTGSRFTGSRFTGSREGYPYTYSFEIVEGAIPCGCPFKRAQEISLIAFGQGSISISALLR